MGCTNTSSNIQQPISRQTKYKAPSPVASPKASYSSKISTVKSKKVHKAKPIVYSIIQEKNGKNEMQHEGFLYSPGLGRIRKVNSKNIRSYVGHIQNKCKDGFGTLKIYKKNDEGLFSQLSSLYEGFFQDGEKNGFGILEKYKGNMTEYFMGCFKRGTKNGFGELIYKEGKKMMSLRGMFKENKKNGYFTEKISEQGRSNFSVTYKTYENDHLKDGSSYIRFKYVAHNPTPESTECFLVEKDKLMRWDLLKDDISKIKHDCEEMIRNNVWMYFEDFQIEEFMMHDGELILKLSAGEICYLAKGIFINCYSQLSLTVFKMMAHEIILNTFHAKDNKYLEYSCFKYRSAEEKQRIDSFEGNLNDISSQNQMLLIQFGDTLHLNKLDEILLNDTLSEEDARLITLKLIQLLIQYEKYNIFHTCLRPKLISLLFEDDNEMNIRINDFSNLVYYDENFKDFIHALNASKYYTKDVISKILFSQHKTFVKRSLVGQEQDPPDVNFYRLGIELEEIYYLPQDLQKSIKQETSLIKYNVKKTAIFSTGVLIIELFLSISKPSFLIQKLRQIGSKDFDSISAFTKEYTQICDTLAKSSESQFNVIAETVKKMIKMEYQSFKDIITEIHFNDRNFKKSVDKLRTISTSVTQSITKFTVPKIDSGLFGESFRCAPWRNFIRFNQQTDLRAFSPYRRDDDRFKVIYGDLLLSPEKVEDNESEGKKKSHYSSHHQQFKINSKLTSHQSRKSRKIPKDKISTDSNSGSNYNSKSSKVSNE